MVLTSAIVLPAIDFIALIIVNRIRAHIGQPAHQCYALSPRAKD